MIKYFYLIFLMTMLACRSIPEGITAINDFDKNRYLGKWYEIARIDFRFEKDLNNTTAEYSLRPDGKIKVVNRGFNYKKNKWKYADGKARLVNSEKVGMLKVSFFGPFYAGYNILKLDNDYKYVLVAGKNLNYLWILSRTTTIPEVIKNEYLQFAQSKGFDTSRLLWITHDMETSN